jgi:NADP-dependent 3-hydroxy acid dehydrogenase YdfG
VAARRTDRLDALVRRLADRGARAVAVELDVTDAGACAAAVQRTVDELGALDVLVNNAGIMLLGPIETADVAEWTRMVNTNVLGLMYMTHAALPHLLRRGGAVVQMSSAAGRVTRPSTAVYNASKFAVGAFSDVLRQEVAERGVRVIVVEPGAVETPLREHITDEPRTRDAGAPSRRAAPLDPEDVARAVVFALSQPAHVAMNEISCGPPARLVTRTRTAHRASRCAATHKGTPVCTARRPHTGRPPCAPAARRDAPCARVSGQGPPR